MQAAGTALPDRERLARSMYRAEIHLARSDRWVTVATARRPGTARYLAAKFLTRAGGSADPADRSRVVAAAGAPLPADAIAAPPAEA